MKLTIKQFLTPVNIFDILERNKIIENACKNEIMTKIKVKDSVLLVLENVVVFRILEF